MMARHDPPMSDERVTKQSPEIVVLNKIEYKNYNFHNYFRLSWA